jgi:hypothetical protein
VKSPKEEKEKNKIGLKKSESLIIPSLSIPHKKILKSFRRRHLELKRQQEEEQYRKQQAKIEEEQKRMQVIQIQK